jgi:hypothetical protein
MDTQTTELDPRLLPGGNNPPVDLRADILERYADSFKDAADLLALAALVPAEIPDDGEQKKLNDLVKKMQARQNKLEVERDIELEPHAKNVSIITTAFNNPRRDLDNKRKDIKARGTEYSKKKEREEQARLEKEAEEKRIAAAESLRKGQEAEAAKVAASAAANEFERLSNEAKVARAGAVTAVEVAEASVATIKAAIQKIRFDIANADAGFKNRVMLGETVTDEEKQDARDEFKRQLEAEQGKLASANEALASAKTAAREAKEAADKIADQLAEKNKEVRTHASVAKQALGDAVQHEQRADKIEKRADEPGLGRTYSDHGAMSTLSSNWTFELEDISLLPLNVLRHLIARDALEAAIRKWMLGQPPTEEARKMTGVRFYIEQVGVNR